MESDTLTLQEAAELLGKSTQTVRRLIKSGVLQAQRIETPQGFQYAVLRSSLSARFTRVAPAVTQNPQPQQRQEVQDVKVSAVEVPPVHYDWYPFLTNQNQSSGKEAQNLPESFLENDYYVLEPSPVQEKADKESVSNRQFMEFVQMAHKEKLMLITILERLQAELERERRQPKTVFQWIGQGLKAMFGSLGIKN